MQNMNEIKPRNAVEALRYAKTAERARNIITEGYTFEKDADSDVIAVVKPGTTAAAYWLNMLEPGCDCPDYMGHKDYCKHTLAYEMVQALADEQAHMDFLCDQYDNMECSTGCDYSDHHF